MRILCIGGCLLAAMASGQSIGQITLPTNAPLGAPARVQPPGGRLSSRPGYRGPGVWGPGVWGPGVWGGGWGGGWGGTGAWGPAPVASAPPQEPKAPILASSSHYEADRARPVMREYDALPEPVVAGNAAVPANPAIALLAFRDGRVEPVWAYWREGHQLAYVALGDTVRKVPVDSLDRPRSEKLNRQQGHEFHWQPERSR